MRTAEDIELTKGYIMSALFALMEEAPYENITISDIIKKAGVSRATYYRHFKTKDDVIRNYFVRETKRFTISTPVDTLKPDDYYEVIFNIFSRLKENKILFRRLLESRLELLYLDYLNSAMVQKFAEMGYEDYAYEPFYATGCLFNVSIQWVKNDCGESVKYMTDRYLGMAFVGRSNA